jgi:two-component system, NarL family, invasion response regulator UvrY
MTERTSAGPVRTLTVDDYGPFLAAARRVIMATPGFESAGEVASAEEAFAVIDAAEPHLALVDVHMPQINGVEVARRIMAEHPAILVVLISAQEADQLPAAVHECGAAAVMRKQDLNPRFLRELWRAVGSSYRGRING